MTTTSPEYAVLSNRCTATRLAAALAATAVLVLTPAVPARAADDVRWIVQPSGLDGPAERTQFAYDLGPGRRVDDHVAITNLARRPLTFAVYATDAATTVDGAFALLPASGRPRDTGAWITLHRHSVTVAPGKRAVVPFRVVVPASAAPGDHAAGIIAAISTQGTDGSGNTVTVDRRIAARVYLRVPGVLRPSVQVTAVQTSYANPLLPFARGAMTVRFRVRNAGNVRTNGAATVRATGPFGARLGAAVRLDLPELLPGAEVELTGRVTDVVPAAMLTGTVSLAATTSEGALPTETRAATVWAVPYTLLLVLAVAGAAVMWRRHHRSVPTADTTGLPAPVRV